MDANERLEQRRVVVDTPDHRREVVTETSRQGPQESSISAGMVGIIAVLALVAIGIAVYIVSNKNANDAANREAAAQIAAQEGAAQQPPPGQQAPIIIQQPAQVQQPPVIVQQPVAVAVPESGTTIDDSTMLELATKRLGEDQSLVLVIPTITNGRAVLTGSVSTSTDKIRAETIVKAVRGVKSVDNRISISNP